MTQNVKNQEAGSSQAQIRNVRIQKMENLRERGLNPYPYGYDKDIMAQDLQDKYKDLAAGEEMFPVTVAVWFLIRTVTRSPFCASAVVVVGVRISEPSSLT